MLPPAPNIRTSGASTNATCSQVVVDSRIESHRISKIPTEVRVIATTGMDRVVVSTVYFPIKREAVVLAVLLSTVWEVEAGILGFVMQCTIVVENPSSIYHSSSQHRFILVSGFRNGPSIFSELTGQELKTFLIDTKVGIAHPRR